MGTEVVAVRVETGTKDRLTHLADRQGRALADVVRDFLYAGMVATARDSAASDERRLGQRIPRDNTATRTRQVMPQDVADGLLRAHLATGGSYRKVARALDVDVAMWWRMCRGERVPSRPVAERIIARLGLDNDLAEDLRAAAVDG
jgi:hypothetical protein